MQEKINSEIFILAVTWTKIYEVDKQACYIHTNLFTQVQRQG